MTALKDKEGKKENKMKSNKDNLAVLLLSNNKKPFQLRFSFHCGDKNKNGGENLLLGPSFEEGG